MQTSNQIMVSICCLAYNHQKYIQKALDSFLMQKTSFSIEIIVHDDASTDGTSEIIREYADKFPDIVKPIFQKENCFSKGEVFGVYTKYIFPKAKGRYLAFCEGDDYWIDPDKLQLQFEYMENHPECALASHNVYNEDVVSGQRTLYYKKLPSGEYSVESVLSATTSYPHTTSLFCRTETFKNTPEFYLESPVPDTPMIFQCLTKGNIYYSDKVMSVWRFAHTTSWTYSMRYDTRNNQIHCLKMFNLYDLYDKMTNGKYHVPLLRHSHQYKQSIFLLEAFGENETLEEFYQRIAEYILSVNRMENIKKFAEDLIFTPIWGFMKQAAAQGKKLFIYGAGQYGNAAAKTMKQIGLPLQGFIVSDGQCKEEESLNAPVYYRSELPDDLNNIGILIAMKQEYAKEVWTAFDDHENVWYPFSL